MTKILVVEDNEKNLDLVVQVLEDDYEVVIARDGEQALHAVAEHRPALVLMDLSMPVMDGWTAIERLRADPAWRTLPIIAVSAHAIADEIARARQVGCDDFVTKPIDDEELHAKIRALLARTAPTRS